MPYLGDVNLLLATIDSTNAHHAIVRTWFEKRFLPEPDGVTLRLRSWSATPPAELDRSLLAR